MPRVNTSVLINCPIEEVFDHWADGRLSNDWNVMAVAKDVTMLTPEPIGRGSRFRGTFKVAGESEYEIVEYQRPHLLKMVASSPLGPLYHTVTCESVPGGTLLRQTADGDLRGLFKLLRPIVERSTRRNFRANDLALKRYLEETARAGGGVQGAQTAK